jgi:hypothetical protein
MNNTTGSNKTVIVQTEELHTERNYAELISAVNEEGIPNELQ